MFNPCLEERRQRKLKLLEMIQQNHNIKKEKLIALFSLQTGLTRRIVLEYISELEATELIKKNE